MISSPAASTARNAACCRSAADMRLVRPTKIGAVPSGSVITSSVTNVSPTTRQDTAEQATAEGSAPRRHPVPAPAALVLVVAADPELRRVGLVPSLRHPVEQWIEAQQDLEAARVG